MSNHDAANLVGIGLPPVPRVPPSFTFFTTNELVKKTPKLKMKEEKENVSNNVK